MPKNIILKIRKSHSLEKIQSSKNCENGRFFGPGGPKFYPFSQFFANHFSKKVSKSKKLQKWQKKGKKWPLFLH